MTVVIRGRLFQLRIVANSFAIKKSMNCRATIFSTQSYFARILYEYDTILPNFFSRLNEILKIVPIASWNFWARFSRFHFPMQIN